MMPTSRIVPLALVLGCMMAGCNRDSASSAGEPASKLAAPTVPDALRAGDGETLTTKALAQGTQNYECQAGDNGSFAWKLIGPDAQLADEAGKPLGKHYAGPTWEALDGSKVVGEVKAKTDAPGGAAVPWLLLKAKSTSGAGLFAKVTSVQRVDTVGGAAPPTGCDAQHVGAKHSAGYKATYYFYSAK
jgi:Protein of unknown function (DUF3455)